MIPEAEANNFNVFLDCLSVAVVAALTPAGKRRGKKGSVKGRKNVKTPVQRSDEATSGSDDDAAELSEFVQV